MNSGKVRIYELSKELNLDNKDLLAVCEQLNISVKSHSSTITDSEAERIRAAAQKQAASRPSSAKPAQPRQGHSQNTESRSKAPAPVQKKQQILEIRKPAIRQQVQSPEPPVPPSYAGPQSVEEPPAPTPTPVKLPPSRPMELPEDVVAVAAELALEPVELAPVDVPEQESSPEPEPIAVETDGVEAPVEISGQPELSGPPVRPSAAASAPKASLSSRPVLRRAQPDQASQEGKDISEGAAARDSSKPARLPRGEATPAPKAPARSAPGNRPDPNKPSVDRPTPRPQTIVELRRPRPVRPGDDVAAREEQPSARSGDGGEVAELILKPNRPKPAAGDAAAPTGTEVQLHRPIPPRAAKKGKNWQEEEEDVREFPEKAKVATKGKRRTQPSLDEDEEELENILDKNVDAPMQVSLSLVRPAKPKSLRQTQVKPPAAITPKARRQSVSRDRRDRREEAKLEKPTKVVMTGSLTVQELSALLMVPETEIIRTLFMKGIAATVTQTLDIPTATMVAEELGIEVETGEKEAEARKVTEMLDASDLENLQRRPPVVTIMGHVDHGKTTLLDSIRKTKVAQGEAGGITQHIGAYHVDVEHNGQIQQVVFLDTPGHEAFTAMRARGARVTDIAVLVVAADDGVRPQTIEAISHAKAAEVPIVVAINKVDKEEAQPDRVKQELTEFGLVPEEWGGDTIMVPVSAITGDNLDTLLEMLLLVAEVEDLYANPDRAAKGTVIEAHLDKAKGPVATLLIQNGTLHVGDILVAGSALGKVRAMVNDRLQRVREATPSFAVEVLGLSDVPAAGDEFLVFGDEKEARSVASARLDEQRQTRLLRALASRPVSLNTFSERAQEGELKELNLVLKADVQGSVEAILGALKELPQKEVQVRVLHAAPGEVSETDVDLAAASSAVIIGFNTTLATGARQAADRVGVDVREYNIIYNLLDDIQAAMEGLLEPELIEEALGQAEVRAVFPVGRGAVAGCYVQLGKVVRNSKVRVRRNGAVIHEGNLDSLKRMKEDTREVNTGYECGIGLDNFNAWETGDVIESYRMISKRRTLSK
ncbi:translation initiation factor IF-2 [Kovacikia minuta CCNUW1]|uniref:translation initiation factor IF-2 n=1 Tax=Kovacikia minuta TaxID=2931930 RepID=UPI001CCB89F8|nr:translation initiation factor IF-2 [Kovacikia minuta]UBF25332.1 translation initiation factor IF-2 [Kovacikia minuta CCNUW1]